MVDIFSSLSTSSSSSMIILVVCMFSVFWVRVWSDTDVNDVQALEVMYGALGNPSQLTGWKSSGGDPCSEYWMGVKCDGSAVVSLELSSLGLNGTLGYLLSNLISLNIMDLSDNKIHDIIPFQMPPNLVNLNLAKNNLSGNLPYSILSMDSLEYLNVSRNLLSGPIVDVFPNHTALATLDLSHNNFSGDLPSSLSLLSNLSTLQVQNNQLTGSLDLLVDLPLNNLNVAHNNFTGLVPQELNSISNFVFNGNSFENEPAPSPSSPITPPRRKSRKKNHGSWRDPLPETSVRHSSHGNKHSSSVATVIGIVLGASLLLLLALLALLLRKKRQKIKDKSPLSQGSVSNGTKKERREQRITSRATMADMKPIPSEKFIADKFEGRNGSLRHTKPTITTATSYTIATLQTATNSFSQDNIVGEGSLGRVYTAEFSNGKVLAIKKIDNSALSLQEEDSFLEAVSNMSRLRHPNVVTLVGYCTEYGQRLLVYEYIRNGNLHDILHFSDDGSRILTWNGRVKVALGTARALEYLHEVCVPSLVHRNLKSCNILLDEEFNPLLSDCGLAALTPNTERQVSTQMIGSFGYSAPEFVLSGIYTTKSDVYSFGVVMLELLTGRMPLDSSKPRSEQSLVRWATPQLHDIDALAKMVDPSLNGMYPAKSLSRFADIIALCVQPEPEFRPPMSEVVQALVRLVQRAGIAKRRPSDESGGYGFKTPDHEAIDISI